MSLKFSRK